MASLTIQRPWTSPTLRQGVVVRQLMVWVDIINVAAAVLRPVAVSVAVITAAATWSAPAHADPLGGLTTNVLNNIGVGNIGTAGIGWSLCPTLARPGETFALTAVDRLGRSRRDDDAGAGWVGCGPGAFHVVQWPGLGGRLKSAVGDERE